jgi:DNA-binding CsgD family transcriptional regulator
MRNVQDLKSLYSRLKREPKKVNGEYKKLLDGLFLFPNQFAYVIDYTLGEIKAHKGFDSLLGFRPDQINLLFFYRSHFYPKDQPLLDEIIYRAIEWGSTISTKPFEIFYQIDYRVMKADGSHIRVMRQSTILETDENGAMVSTLSICTDISHLKMEGKIVGRVEGPSSQMAQFDDLTNGGNITSRKIEISVREAEILSLIAIGKTSQEISNTLNISLHTVNTHRRNILEGSGYRNMTQLIMEALKQGLID